MATKEYTPVASYSDLKRVETEINNAPSVAKIREIVHKDGPKIGYKAFCYILSGRMTPESMKPDEACVAAITLEQNGDAEAALDIFKKVAEAHPNHPIAAGKVG